MRRAQAKGIIMSTKTVLALAVSAVFAASASANQQPIERITVTANKFSQPVANTLATVELITRDDIDASNARDLPSLLETSAGLDVVRSGGFGQLASVFVRGAATKHVLVLIDGMRVSDGNSGAVPFSTIAMNSIQRIEIVKGARAAIYGADAIAGVINIITRDAQSSDTQSNKVALSSGSNNYVNLEGVFSTTKDALSVSANLGYETTDGYDVTIKDESLGRTKDHDNDGYTNKNLGVNVQYQTAELGKLYAKAQYAKGEADYDNAWGNDAFDFTNYTTQLGWQKSTEQFSHQVSASHSQDKNTQTGTPAQTTYQTKRTELDARTLYQHNQALAFNGGISWLNEDVSGSTAEFSMAKRDNLGVFAGAYYQQQQWLANATLRSDDFEDYGRQNTYNLGFGYRPVEQVTLRLSHGTAFRAPSFSDLYTQNNQWVAANTALKAEEATNNEFGVHINSSVGQFDIALFSNKIDNLISSSFDPDSGKYKPFNVDKATMEGLELSSEFNALSFTHQFNFTYLDAKDDTTGAKLPRRPARSVNYTLSRQWDKLTLLASMRYRSSRPTISYFNSTMGGFTVFDLSANYQVVDNLTLSARIDNLTDKHYLTAATGFAANGQLLGYKPLRRQLFVGMSYQF